MNPTPCQTENGSIIITIVVMLVLISLGAGVVLMFSSATVQRAEHANRLRAAQLAEAGFRYAAGEYRSAGSISDKFDRLAALHGEEVTLQSGNGSFTLDIRPYWFVLETAVSDSAGLTLKVPGKFPDGYADTLPSSGTVRINDNFYDYTGGTISLGTGLAPDRFLITLESAVTLPKNTSVQMAFFSPMSQNITAGGDIVLSADNTLLDLLPERNGLIELFKDATHSLGTYRYRERKTGSIILSDISPVSDDELPFSLSSSSLIVLKKQAKVLSHSKLGSGYLTSDLGMALNVYLTDQVQIPEDNSEPLNLGGAGAARHDPFEDEIDGHTQLENWEFDADNSVPERDKKTITTQTVRTEFGGDWDSARYVTFQNFTETNQDHGYTADVVDKERLPEAVRSRNLNGVWGNASNNIYFVGDHGTIMHWDGIHYSLMNSTTTENLNAIWGVPDIKTDPDELDNIFVVGDNGMTLITQNGSWIRAHHNETYDIHAAWGTSWGHFDGYGEAGTNPYNWDSPQTADQLANYNWYINEFGGHVNFRCLWATEHTYRYAPDYGGTGYRPHQNIIVGEFFRRCQ